MKKLFLLSLLLGVPFLSAQNFNLQLGDYAGTLTYTDYTSGRQVVLNQMEGKFLVDNGKSILSTKITEGTRVYPSEMRIAQNGNQVTFGENQWTIVEEKSHEGKITEWTLTRRGVDGNDNKPCTFKMLLHFQDDMVTWRKEVKFDDETQYFMRNQYDLRKKSTTDDRHNESNKDIDTDHKTVQFGTNPTQKFSVKGRRWLGTQVYVRIQLPEDPENRNFGFMQHLSRNEIYSFAVPVGAKIWVCDGRYWDDYKPKEYVYKTVGALDDGEIHVNDLRFNARKL